MNREQARRELERTSGHSFVGGLLEVRDLQLLKAIEEVRQERAQCPSPAVDVPHRVPVAVVEERRAA